MKNINKTYKIGQIIGLNKKEINEVLRKITNRKEQPSFSVGPPCYPGNFYGVVSIKDF